MDENQLNLKYLDLRGLSCPINFVKCCLALENLPADYNLQVDLDEGEAGDTVMDGLKEKGFKVHISKRDNQMISLIISGE